MVEPLSGSGGYYGFNISIDGTPLVFNMVVKQTGPISLRIPDESCRIYLY